MPAIESLAQYTSHTLTSYGITKPSEVEPEVDNKVFSWDEEDGILLILRDGPHILAMDFDADNFGTNPRGRVCDAVTGKTFEVSRRNLPAMATYMLQIIRAD